MIYPTPMDVAEADDFAADDYCEDGCTVMGEHAVCSTSPSERLANICAALEEDLSESPFTREEWERMDAERPELLAANDALAMRVAELEQQAVIINNGFNAAVDCMEQVEARLDGALQLLREVVDADKYDWNMGLEDRVREAIKSVRKP